LQDCEDLLASIQQSDWAPDLLYFNSGSWDSGGLSGEVFKGNYTRVDVAYGRLLDLIAEKCDPTRQVKLCRRSYISIEFSATNKEP
jgi:hypothetical protein